MPKRKNRSKLFRKTLLDKQNGRCKACNGLMISVVGSDSYPTIEHVHQLWAGGRDVESNIVLTCKKCNQGRNFADQAKRGW